MKKVMLFVIVSGVLVCSAMAQNTTPLKIYSGGIGAGAMVGLEPEDDASSGQFLKLSFVNMWQFREQVALYADVNWFAPGRNFGAEGGFSFMFSTSYFRPFFGFGVGGHSFESEDGDFSTDFGPSATAHIGFMLEITETVQIRARVPYYVVLNEARNQGAGFDVGIMFKSPLSGVKRIHP